VISARQVAESTHREWVASTLAPRELNYDVFSWPHNWIYRQKVQPSSRQADQRLSQAQGSAGGSSSLPLGSHKDLPNHLEEANPVRRPHNDLNMIGTLAGQAIWHPPRWKRTFDLVAGCTAMLLLSPLFLCAALWIRLSSPGPVFFRQLRVGHLGIPFTIWKFRTMSTDVDPAAHRLYVAQLAKSNQPLAKIDRQLNLIPLGTLFRKSAIDELPQLLNVIRGEMSLVGPRPDVIPIAMYSPVGSIRFDVFPGITGLWQVTGKNKSTFEEMVLLDATYVRNSSLWLDLKILAATLPTLISQLRGNTS
jgi:lipopolysaccharide/colanic/teichoic acid biosynthesis glycosyltransferase